MARTLMQYAPDRPGQRREIIELGPWFHNLHLPDGTQTAPDHPLGDFPSFKWKQLRRHLPEDLTGWTALDIGCNAGFYTFELARLGATVTGIDVDDRFLSQATWAAGEFGLNERVSFRRTTVYDLGRTDDCFDLILFMGVFYHLRYPLLGLDIVSERVRQLMVFQTLTMPGTRVYRDTRDREIDDRGDLHQRGWPKMAFIEERFAGDTTNWWIANNAGVAAMLRSTGMEIVARPGHEIYLCVPNPSIVRAEWDRAELRAATGTAGRAVP